MTTEKIAPCPWCGKEPAVLTMYTYNGASHYRVECMEDGHTVSGPKRKTRAGAIKAWNERRSK